jgi:FtsP/CotA-like multicopper oxidase with cupredoxin domain
MNLCTRRKFLRTLAIAGTTALAGSQVRFLSGRGLTPRLVTSQGGVLDLSLTAQASRLLIAGRPAALFSYNGWVPGPRIEIRPGDQVRLRFTNALSEPTNLHFHGLHIPPSGNADNVFLEIPPMENQVYEFTLPQDHRSGTYWYHPHIHHLIARQVWAGLVGLMIVRGELDDIPEIRNADEEFLVLKDFGLDANGELLTPDPTPQIMQGREGNYVLVNGELNPTFPISKDGLLRLRFLNASVARYYRLQLEDHPMYLIATDGGPIDEPFELGELLLAPGERAEVLIRGERSPGRYRLMNLPYRRSNLGMMGGGGMRGMGMMGGRPSSSDESIVLATLEYRERKRSLSLPSRLVPVEPLPQAIQVRQLVFSHTMMRMGGDTFTINGSSFDPERIDTVSKVGTVEEWEIVNGGGMMMDFDHPFHIHTNQFQVVSEDDRSPRFRAWRDIANVRMGGSVRIRIPFWDFPGKTVYHCHILDHEDLGMMAVIEMRT